MRSTSGVFAQPEVNSGIVGREITAVASRPALDGCAILPHQFHHASVSGTIGADSLQMNQHPMSAVRHGVQQQARGTVVVGDQNIHSAVVVHVAENRRPADLQRLQRRAG